MQSRRTILIAAQLTIFAIVEPGEGRVTLETCRHLLWSRSSRGPPASDRAVALIPQDRGSMHSRTPNGSGESTSGMSTSSTSSTCSPIVPWSSATIRAATNAGFLRTTPIRRSQGICRTPLACAIQTSCHTQKSCLVRMFMWGLTLDSMQRATISRTSRTTSARRFE